MTLKLREKILVPVVLTIALGMVAGFFYSYLSSTRAIEESVRKAVGREVRTTAQLMDQWLTARHTDLLSWSMTPVFAEALIETGYYGKSARKEAANLLETLENGYPYYDFLFIADTNGYLISTSHRSTPKQYIINDREYFKASIQGAPWISDIIISRESGEKIFAVSVPLLVNNKIVGILAGGVNVTDFSRFFIHDFKLDQKGFAYLAEKNGQVIAISAQNKALSRINDHDFGRQILETGKGSLVFSHGGEQLLSAYTTLNKKEWVLVVTQSLDEAFGSAREIGWYTLGAGLILLILVCVVVAGIFRKMVYLRFDRMLEAIGMVEQGHLDVRIHGGDENDEIGELTKAFNTMTARLETTLSSLQYEIQVRKKTEKVLANHRDTLEVRVTDRTAELSALQNYLSDMINSMPSIIVGVTHGMVITQWNLKAELTTGLSGNQVAGSQFKGQFPHLSSQVDNIAKAIKDKQIFHLAKVARLTTDVSLPNASDQAKPGYDDITVYPLMSKGMEGAVIRIDDVTDRVALEEMMVQSEKMMSVGGLAAGMAHEINNPLAGILQNIQVLKNRMSKDLPKNTEVARDLGIDPSHLHEYMEKRGMYGLIDNAIQAGGRAAEIVDNMLSFSRKGHQTTSCINLADLMNRTLDLAQNEYNLKQRFDFKAIEIIRAYKDKKLSILCNPSMLQQVFFNILKNGAQAMASWQAGPRPAFIISIEQQGSNAVIQITDNGPGMDKDTCRRVFEPFFTTKGVGKGTGLGLSVSYFIISENHGGTIEVLSEPGQGSSFVIQLPIAENHPSSTP